MDVLLMIVYATIVLGFLVFIHEGGHYLAARAFGVRDRIHAGLARSFRRFQARRDAFRRYGGAFGRIREGVRHGGGRDETAFGSRACGTLQARHGEHGRHRARLRHYRR